MAVHGQSQSLPSSFDEKVLKRTAKRLRQQGLSLPTFAQLAAPSAAPPGVAAALEGVGRDDPNPLNLWRVHWYNHWEGFRPLDVPSHVVLPPQMTGVEAPIIVAFGDTFPMIGSHKLLAAYSCLIPRLVTGAFDPTVHRAVWPSTGNFARGGVAISRILGCRSVAVLPENMSRERFEWLRSWVSDPSDVVVTPGSESNVKEIYDACARLAAEAEEKTFIFNQFSEYSNQAGHYAVTGRALAHLFHTYLQENPSAVPSAFVSASGSAGTLGAGDFLKDHFGTKIVAVEALECPTMLYNGYGEHNIQGIGDKHIPLIHNVMNTDAVVGVSDAATDGLFLSFGSKTGLRRLASLGVSPEVLPLLSHFGLSSICNVLAAIKYAKTTSQGHDDVILTVATDGAGLYRSERKRLLRERFGGIFGAVEIVSQLDRHLFGADVSDVEILDDAGRNRIFNLGYYTWVEQQGVSLEDFERRRYQSFWKGLHAMPERWDEMITSLNSRSGLQTG